MSRTGRNATRPSMLTAEDTDDAVWTAQRMVLDAGVQAARLRRQATAQTATICEIAEREAETIWRQASARAAAMREAAEREAAQLQVTVMRLSAAGPVTEPAARPAGPPAARPSTARPRTSPARRPQGPPPRQLVAIRVAAVATAALLFFAFAAGVTEVALHGFAFFVFRSAGTGETPASGLQEDQGPGQPDAPRPAHSHLAVQPSPRSTESRDGHP
jgi:hypothetical protein